MTAYEDLPTHLRNLADQLWAVHSNAYDYAAATIDLPEEVLNSKSQSFFQESDRQYFVI